MSLELERPIGVSERRWLDDKGANGELQTEANSRARRQQDSDGEMDGERGGGSKGERGSRQDCYQESRQTEQTAGGMKRRAGGRGNEEEQEGREKARSELEQEVMRRQASGRARKFPRPDEFTRESANA